MLNKVEPLKKCHPDEKGPPLFEHHFSETIPYIFPLNEPFTWDNATRKT